jgi:hypothetical protein
MQHFHIDCGFGGFGGTEHCGSTLQQFSFPLRDLGGVRIVFLGKLGKWCSPRTASSATLALKSGEWFLRGLRLMISPFLANIVDPKSRAVIFYPCVRISGACSDKPEPHLGLFSVS